MKKILTNTGDFQPPPLRIWTLPLWHENHINEHHLPTFATMQTSGSALADSEGQKKKGQRPSKVCPSRQDVYSFGGSKSPFWVLPRLCYFSSIHMTPDSRLAHSHYLLERGLRKLKARRGGLSQEQVIHN